MSVFKLFKKKNGDIIEFYINEDTKTITKYKNEVAVKEEVSYEGLLSYSQKLVELCDDTEERNKICGI